MEIFHSMIRYLQDYVLFNPVVWGILAVVLWIAGSAFIRAWRGKDKE
jgi:hypothetical protein